MDITDEEGGDREAEHDADIAAGKGRGGQLGTLHWRGPQSPDTVHRRVDDPLEREFYLELKKSISGTLYWEGGELKRGRKSVPLHP